MGFAPRVALPAMTRQCARPGCSQPAVATLTYDYGNQAAWLDRLAPEPHPMTHDLCETHAERLSVPQGWWLEDRRTVSPITPAHAAAGTPAPAQAPVAEAPTPVVAGLFHSQLAS